MRLILAFQCFFLILFGRRLPAKVAPYLPEGLPEAKRPEQLAAPKGEEPKVERVEKIEKKKVDQAQPQRDGALVLLALFQREGRLVDFLREELEGHDDAAIGAAARDVHRGCKKVLDEHFAFEPMLPGEEEAAVTVPRGFDPSEIRLIGEAKGEPPFKGTLRHHGWRATQAKLPGLADGVDRTVVAPAEVEVGSRA
jgi:hypothetical protein